MRFRLVPKIDDLERPLSEIQGHLFLKCRKNCEIQLSKDFNDVEWLDALYIY